ncbi:putative spore protein YtfJ [Oxalobacteraceae bacterium GrIS 2.11]
MNRLALASLFMMILAACGGSSSPLGNPPTVINTPVTTNQSLSFAYYQRCINPIFEAQLQSASGQSNTCSSAGCHAYASGAGGALRIIPTAQLVDVTNSANTSAVIKASDMYKNFYSTQSEVVVASPTQSRLLNKPLLRGVLHGGGLIFSDANDPHVRLMSYWINNPAPLGADEFSPATYNMFTPAGDPINGACNTQ